ncbi:hypothetical protein [Cellulomonas sp. URHD0024]|uniref:hypothetical protein n=1 Tax=Cellulomonas sp. URHD0024 TaxID=1302620 RepID=UPI00041CE309|nr:hypothetical protein [Cellulomonas sp. URHD0024]
MVLATAAVLAGCAGQPGAAAVVDGTPIPTSDLQTALDEIKPYVPGATPSAVLGALVVEPTVSAMAAEAGVGGSDEDAKAYLDAVVKNVSPEAHPTFSPASIAIGRYFVAFTNLSNLSNQNVVSDDITKRIADLDVEVNPRFGTLGEDNKVAPAVPPTWLVDPSAPKPADGQTPAPSPSATP